MRGRGDNVWRAQQRVPARPLSAPSPHSLGCALTVKAGHSDFLVALQDGTRHRHEGHAQQCAGRRGLGLAAALADEARGRGEHHAARRACRQG